jgi:antitoxin component of MazEF toxin-antitoxin module
MKRLVKVLPAAGEDEVRVPASCLPALVAAEGEKAELRVSSAGLVVRPLVVKGDSRRQAAVLADEMEGLEEHVQEVLTTLPQPSDAALEHEIPYDVDTEVVTTLECVLQRDVAPAIRSLRDAASTTAEALQAHWERERAARQRSPVLPPPGKLQ